MIISKNYIFFESFFYNDILIYITMEKIAEDVQKSLENQDNW